MFVDLTAIFMYRPEDNYICMWQASGLHANCCSTLEIHNYTTAQYGRRHGHQQLNLQ